MNKIVIVHFAPIELYPPILNLIRTVESNFNNGIEAIKIITTAQPVYITSKYFSSNPLVNIYRFGKSSEKLGPIQRYWNYLFFFVRCFLTLVWQRPKKILYFETISSGPVYLYKRFVKRDCVVMIHYHEYTAPKEHTGVIKYLHYFEMYLYPISAWVSHTNRFRMDYFAKDILPLVLPNPQILCNYPPKSWQKVPRTTTQSPLKIVYIGALGLTSMYVNEFANWVSKQKGKVQWDIYAWNYSNEVKLFFDSLDCNFIRLNKAVDYFSLPTILEGYDVGVILYKGVIYNHVYSVSNKLFEYLTIGLDVWFPSEIKGSLDLVSRDRSPKVIPIDFNRIDEIELIETSKKTEIVKTYNLSCEEELLPLLNLLFEK